MDLVICSNNKSYCDMIVKQNSTLAEEETFALLLAEQNSGFLTKLCLTFCENWRQ